ncbi:Serine/threonine-protein kinase pim-3 [Anabarilius grahami]|uniref:non-specific serine/threonine protein kinase n=1 Tax=Anabarilius grahami TaxID=495550 RepID=A0A3N0XW53_ANAGA|nr:Serine/threonine-protein kinase pim-3 [Anabarilius grahami]
MANKDPSIPQIIQLLDWQDNADHCIMVMERPLPYMDMFSFMELHGGSLNEGTAQHVMRQVIHAVNVCCECSIFHRDIKLENLDTMEVKLIDFGCGAFLKKSAFKFFSEVNCPPEVEYNDKYHTKPTTVWSLGIFLFVMVFGGYPTANDLFMFFANIWTSPGLLQSHGVRHGEHQQNNSCHGHPVVLSSVSFVSGGLT